MKRLKLISLLFVVCFTVVGLLAYRSIRQFSRISTKTAAVEEAQGRIGILTLLETGLKDLDRHEYSYLISRDTSSRRRIQEIVQSIRPETVRLRESSNTKTPAQPALIKLRLEISDRISALRASLKHADTATAGFLSQAYQDGRGAGQRSLILIDSLRQQEATILTERKKSRGQTTASTATNLAAALAGFGLVTLLLFFLLIQELRKSLRYQLRLQDQLGDIKRNQAELDQIAYVVNHHLQEPLRKIRVFSDRLLRAGKDSKLPETTGEGIQRLAAAAERAQSLVSDLAGFTALTMDTDAEKEMLSLRSIVAEEVESIRARSELEMADIFIGDLPLVQGHVRQLSTLFRALLDNALKFSSPERPLQIRIDAYPVDGNLFGETGKAYQAVSVSDNGIGFEDAYADDIFKLFNRLHGSDESYAGKGLGLALAQRIMAQHGGHIAAKGEAGKGARFTLYFPATSSGIKQPDVMKEAVLN